MARFEVSAPVASFTGISAGVAFARGRAVVTSDTAEGLAALYYFKQAGYGIAALDGVEVDDVLSRANESPDAEHTRLLQENRSLKNRLELDDLRKENEKLHAQVFKVTDDERGEGDAQTGATGTTQVELQAPPQESASVTEWRKWVVDSGRGTAEQAKAMDKPAIIAQHGAAYDAERAEQLKAAAAAESGVSA
jgi:hypothetical protein